MPKSLAGAAGEVRDIETDGSADEQTGRLGEELRPARGQRGYPPGSGGRRPGGGDLPVDGGDRVRIGSSTYAPRTVPAGPVSASR